MTVNVSVGLPHTGGLLGLAGVLTVDEFGRVYVSKGAGISVGRSATAVSGAVTFGTLLQAKSATPEQLQNFLTGHAISYGNGALVGSGFTYSPFSGNGTSSFAAEFGVFSPQIGATYSYGLGPFQ
jgi:hypothetical protein